MVLYITLYMQCEEVFPILKAFISLPSFKLFHYNFQGIKMMLSWGIVACPVIQAIGRPDFEDDLRTRSPGKVVSD